MSDTRSQATPARDELAEAIKGYGKSFLGECEEVDVAKIEHSFDCMADGLADYLTEDDGWSKPRTVNSATELDALRVGTRGFTPETWEVWWLRRVGREPHWEGSGGMYSRASDLLAEHGPMTVLFTPGDAG